MAAAAMAATAAAAAAATTAAAVAAAAAAAAATPPLADANRSLKPDGPKKPLPVKPIYPRANVYRESNLNTIYYYQIQNSKLNMLTPTAATTLATAGSSKTPTVFTRSSKV